MILSKKSSKCRLKYLLASLACGSVLLLSGCIAHVNTQGTQFTGLSSQSFNGCTFLVPDAVVSGAVDYHTITDAEYPTSKERDDAIINLIQTAVVGVSDTGFLATKSRDYMFYVAQVDAPTVDLLSCSRDDLINLIGRSDLTFLYYGRGVANADSKEKAVLRVEFRVADLLGAQTSYSGYYGVANIGGNWFVYLAGYKNATEDQLTQCFNCVRSMN